MNFQFQKRKTPIMIHSDRSFENKAVYNPTVIRKDSGIYMLYRAEAHDDCTGCIGLAQSEDGIHFTREEKPVMVPECDYEIKGCEDPRVVEFDGIYYMTYVCVGNDDKGIQIALASSVDLHTWVKHGPIKMERSDWCSEKIKAPAIAPIRVNGKYVLYFLGQKRSWHTAIGIAYSDDLLHWTEDSRNPVLTPRYSHLDCLGVEPGPTPIVIDDKLVLFYNAWDETFAHRTWYAAFDCEDPGKLCCRSEHPLLSPEYDWECNGYVKNIIFSEGIVEMGNQYYMYYGASDTSIGLAISEKLL